MHFFLLDLYVTLIEQGRPFNTKWSDVSIIIDSKVICVFIESSKLSGAITGRKGL